MIKRLCIFFSFIILFVFAFLFFGSSKNKVNNTITSPPPSEAPNKELEKSDEQIYEEIKASIKNTKKVSFDFMSYIKNNIDENVFNDLQKSISDSYYSDDFWYEYTGMSLNVLLDLYKGKIDMEAAKFSNKKSYVSLGFAGDLCLSEGFDTCNFLAEHNEDIYEGIANGLIETTNSFDLFMLNNEFTYSNRGEALSGKYYTFRANPERVEILKTLGTDIVSLSNNHVYDFGADAFYDTLDTLKKANIKYVGAGADIDEAKKAQYFYINGIKIGFVAANRSEKFIFTPEATKDSPGVLRTYDATEYLKVIKKTKSNCDYLVAYVHWGTEDSNVVEDYQKQMGRQYINAGADAVIGGHPHTLQGVEYYNGHPIAYSLGDFWFNNLTDETGVLDIRIDYEGLKNMSFVPCYRTNGVTSLIKDKDESRRILNYLQSISFDISIEDNGDILDIEELE